MRSGISEHPLVRTAARPRDNLETNCRESLMKRRDFIATLGGFAVVGPHRASAQSARTYRLGPLLPGPPLPPTMGRGALLIEELGKRGYKLGQNLVYEPRGAK